MRRRRKRVMKSPEIMLSPMIDMIFLLLVFFIVSTMYMSEVKTIPIRLPVARHSENVSKSNFNVTIKKDGSFILMKIKSRWICWFRMLRLKASMIPLSRLLSEQRTKRPIKLLSS